MDILITPDNCTRLLLVDLPNPKDQTPQSFFCDEDNLVLHEIIKYSEPFRSWFIDNLLCKEGHMNFLTRVDPLFIFVPQLMKYAKQQFRSLHDICQEYANESTTKDKKLCRLECALKPDIDWQQVCDTKDLDGELFVRFDEGKTLSWLSGKHERLCKALEDQLGRETSKATLVSYAIDLVDNYVPASLSDKFKSTIRSKTLQTSDTTTSNNGVEPRGNKTVASTNPSEPKAKKLQASPPPKVIPKNSVLNFFKKT